jgi:hypothetical protein
MPIISNMISGFKAKPVKFKFQLALAIGLVLTCAYLFYSSTEIGQVGDVSYGEPLNFTPTQSFDDEQFSSSDSATNAEIQMEVKTPRFREPERIVVPQFNIVIELAKLIENVRNKPEALLDIQMTSAQKTLENRARIAEFLAQEAKAKLDYQRSAKEMDDMSAGITTVKDIPQGDDINPINATSLLKVNYNTSDFVLKNVRKTFIGTQGLIAYKGRYYTAIAGEQLVPMVKVVSVTSRKVVLNAPSIGKFEVPLEI